MSEDGLTKVPYVQRITSKDGKIHLYFRKGGYRQGPLASAEGSEALRDEVDAILKRILEVQKSNATPRPGTVGGMLKAYNKSADFKGLAGRTQADYQYYIDELTADAGDVHLSDVTRAWLLGLRDAWAERGHNSANKRMQVLKNALAPAVDDPEDKRINGNPFIKIEKVKRPHDAGEVNPDWTDEEVDVAIADALQRNTPGLARAIALGRYGGFRRGTICALPLHARRAGHDRFGAPEKRIVWITEKRKVLCDKREDARLGDLVEATPSRAMTVAYNADGDPWKPRQLNQAIERLMNRLAKAGKVRAAADEDGNIYCPLTIHGLRHARGIEMALAGSSDSEIMAQLEQTTEAAAKIYRRGAERRRLADAAQDKIDNVVSLQLERRQKAASNGS